ncbi:IS607 family element RNA-guided endonuclease TnpB [Mycobacterium sp.]|uniref:IS607 family element RNA-guided endonuclease TnpB n=1 Tax=Mycobacterium sp. TaxID=1785 RepID=UPI003C6AA3AF
MARFAIPEGWTVQAYRFALDPIPAQEEALRSHAGARNFAYNTMLAAVKANLDQRAAEKTYGLDEVELTPCLGWSMRSLRNEWNRKKHATAVREDGTPWWAENSKEAYASGCQSLANALENWSQSRKGRRNGPRMGFPRFRSKRRSAKKLTFTTGALRVEPDRHHVVLPRIGRVRTHESTRKLARRLEAGTARILSATVRFIGGRWQCAFQVIVEGKTRPAHVRPSEHPVVGVDVGVKDLLVVATSDGIEVARIAAPRPLARAQSRLRAAQRQAARRRGPYDLETQTRRESSKRWQRADVRVGRIHARVAAIRAHQIHQATTDLAVGHEMIAVEQLAAMNMARRGGRRKRGLNRALGDAAIGRILAQLGYKSTWYGTKLVTAPRFFASTQLCSRCGVKTKLRLRDRIYRCRNGCPLIDRDLNAAINLARLGEPTYGGTGTGTDSRSAASVTAGNGRGAIQKTSLTTTSGAVGRQEAMKRQPRTLRGPLLRKEKLPEMLGHANTHVLGNG